MSEKKSLDTSDIHNPGDECWTVNCHKEWTDVMLIPEIDRRFAYCPEHIDMWKRLKEDEYEFEDGDGQ